MTIFGPNEIIKDISFIEGVNIDLSKITENSTFEVEVPIPEGAEKVAPATVKIIVEIDIEENLEIQNVPVEVIGLSERMDVAFNNQDNKQVNASVVKGAPATIERIRKEDIKVYIDGNQLAIGEHSVPIQVSILKI
ncbi:hypothetical protein KHA80_09325 [Anaerobacillus sp. HL2]|nr:hypothetical protein KHA80_09325 [Anaerobacillus sp. HL2]